MVGQVNKEEQGGSVYFMVWQTRAFINNVKVSFFLFFPFKKNPTSASNILSHPPPWSPLQVTHSQLQHALDGLALCCQQRQRKFIFWGNFLVFVNCFYVFLFACCGLFSSSTCSAFKPWTFWTPPLNRTSICGDAEGTHHLHLPLWRIFISRKLAGFTGHKCFLQNLISEPWDKNHSCSFIRKW